MKKVYLFIMLCASLLMVGTPAMATPLLQLDIVGGTYDMVSQSVVSGGAEFELVALLNTSSGQYKKLDDLESQEFQLVASWNLDGPNAGSFTIDGDTIMPTSSDVPGNPQMKHGDLGSYGTQIPFYFDDSLTTADYNVQDNPGEFPGYVAGGTLIYQMFDVDLTGLDPFVPIHFDLYSYIDEDKGPGKGGNKVFAPFSHDATGMPEPASMLLLGSGLVGLAAFSRKKFFK